MMKYKHIFTYFFAGIALYSASSDSRELFSSSNEKLALGKELSLEDFKGQTFFASSLRKEGKGMEVRVVFDGDGNVQSIALQASGSPAKGKVKEFDKKNLVVKASAATGKNFNKTAITIDLKQLLFKHAVTSESGVSSRHHSGTLIDSRLGCFNRLKKQKRLGCSDAQVADFAKKYNFSQPSGDRWNTTRVFDELIKPAILDYSEENPPSSKITAKLDVKNTAVTAESTYKFEQIMDSLSKGKKTRLVKGGSGGPWPFKFSKRKDGWLMVQQTNGRNSPVHTAGDNKLVWNKFPTGWDVNGTWIFRKADSNCELKHEKRNLFLKWKCDIEAETTKVAESEEVKTEPVSPEKTEATTTTNNSDQFTKLQLRVSSYLADIKVFLARNPDLPNLLEVLTAVSEVKTGLSGKSEQDLNEAFASLEKTLSNNQDFSNFVTALKAQRQEKLDQAVKTAQALLKKYTAFLRKLITLNMVDNTDLAMALVPISKSIEEQQNSADPKALNSLIEDTNDQLAKLGLAEAFAKELQKSAGASASKTTNNKKQHGAINTGGAENAYRPATIEEFIEFSGAWRSTNDVPYDERFRSVAQLTSDGPTMAQKLSKGQYMWDSGNMWVFPEDLGKEAWFSSTGIEIGWPKVQPKSSDVKGFANNGRYQVLKPDFKIPYPVADLRKEVSYVSPILWFWNADTSVNSDAVVRSEDTFYEYRPDGEKYPGMGKCTLSYSKYIKIRKWEDSRGRVVEKSAQALLDHERFKSWCLYVLPHRKQGEPEIALLVPDPKDLTKKFQKQIYRNYLKNPAFIIFYKLGDGHHHESKNVPAFELADWPNIRKFVKARWEALYSSFKLPENFLSDQNARIVMYIFGLDKWSTEKRPHKTLFVKHWNWLQFCIDDPKHKNCNVPAGRADKYNSAWTPAEQLIWNIDLTPLKDEVYKHWNPKLASAMKKKETEDKSEKESDNLADLYCGKGKADEVSQVLNYITWAEDFGDSPKCTKFWYPADKQNCVYKRIGDSGAGYGYFLNVNAGHQTLTLNDYDPKSLSLEPMSVDTSETTLGLRPWTTIIQLNHAGETLISSDPLREKQPEPSRIQRGLSLIYNGKNCQGTSKAF